MKISEIFYSIQGEIDVGVPALFVRLAECNMIPKCEWCDSKFSWRKQDRDKINEITPREVYEEFKKNKCNRIIFTGGEPTLQLEEICKTLELLKEDKQTIQYDIETNGLKYDINLSMFNNINCSPKKQNYDIDVLRKIKEGCNTRFKFVYENKNNLWFEKIINNINISPSSVYIMPEGKTKEEQEKKTNEVVEYCKNKGFNFSPRLHVIIWGDKRGV